MKRLFITLLSLLSLLLILSCESGGPVAPDETETVIYGTVEQFNYNPIPNATITATPGDYTDVTGSDGTYKLYCSEPGEYQLICSQHGCSDDTAIVTVAAGEQKSHAFYLDTLPTVVSFTTTTHLIRQIYFPPLEYYKVHACVYIYEPDGYTNIEDVLLKIQGSDITYPMVMNPDLNRYCTYYFDVTINEEDLPGETIENIDGENLICTIYESHSVVRDSEPVTISRILDDMPSPAQPRAGEIISDDTLVLLWEEWASSYDFTFTTSIFDDRINELVWERDAIDPDEVSVEVANRLRTGEYWWQIKVVDEYGNSAVSEKAYFSVIE